MRPQTYEIAYSPSSALNDCRFTSVKMIRQQTTDWDAIISPPKVLGIQTTENKKTRAQGKLNMCLSMAQNSCTDKIKADLTKF